MRSAHVFSNEPWHKRSGIPLVQRPEVLSSFWYVKDVCNTILASIEGLADLNLIENKDDQSTFRTTVYMCWYACQENPYDPAKMLQSLQLLKDDLKNQTPPSVLSIERWTTHPLEYRELAITQSMELIQALNAKYLVHD